MSSDGTRVAIGAYGNDGNGNLAGHVRVYEWDNVSWSKVGQDIDGEAVDDEFGRSVSISSDGTRVAIGAIYNGGNGSSAGHVRVFALAVFADGSTHGPRWAQISTARLRATSPGTRYLYPRMGRAWRSALHTTTTTALTPATCGCTLRAAGRGPRWGQTSTARLRTIGPGPRYLCPRTARAWRSALIGTTAPALKPVTCACTLRAAGRGPRWGQTSTARLRTIGSGPRYQCPRTARAWRSVQLGTTATALKPATCACMIGTVELLCGPRWGQTSTARLRATWSGYSVSMSSDGTRVAIGAIRNDGNGSEAGHVRVFDWSMITGSKKILKENIVEVSGELTVSGNATVSSSLTVSGNVTADHFVGDGSNITGISSTLQAITDSGPGANVTSNTVQFSNAITGFVTTSNVEVGGELTVSGNVVVDTNTLFVDSVNNRVGIGTTTPDNKLDVDGNVFHVSTVHPTQTIDAANTIQSFTEYGCIRRLGLCGLEYWHRWG